MQIHWAPQFKSLSKDKGLFLSFEGIEGAGKSTQIKNLTDSLTAMGKNVLCVREPGGTRFGEKLRQAILHSSRPLHPYSEALLFASSRAQLLYEKILPHLEKENSVIICDRYLDSSIVYQGLARELGPQSILDIHSHFPLTVLPHLTFYIKISVECSYERQAARNEAKDYFESEKIDFYQKLTKGYDLVAQSAPQRVKIIDGEQSEKEIKTQILSELKKVEH